MLSTRSRAFQNAPKHTRNRYRRYIDASVQIEKIAKKVTWAFDHSLKRIRLFGVIEVIGALGLLLPYRLDILPILTPMAATGLAMMMAGAGAVHLRRDELKMILLNIFIMFLLAGIGFHTLLDIFNVEM